MELNQPNIPVRILVFAFDPVSVLHHPASAGEFGVGPLLAVLGLAIGAWVHRDGLIGGAWVGRPLDVRPPAESVGAPQPVAPATATAFSRELEGEIIDAEYRVVS